MKKIFTSESVCIGHPDKLCDLISDSLLDKYLEGDKLSRVAIETVAGKNTIFITGEVTSNTKVDIEKEVRETIKSVGYFGKDYDIDYKTCDIIINLSKQSSDIAIATSEENLGAGDQGIMFGYACCEANNYMPWAIYYASKIAERLEFVRRENIIKDIGADGKCQVSVEYDDDKIKRVDTVVVSIQHKEVKDIELLKKEIKEKVINYIIDSKYLDSSTKYYINPTSKFVIGGPLGDSGLTGRKIIVDTYGGYAPHGGGAFSGKDPTKVDRSASYMARLIAKNVILNKYATKCLIELSYAIGVKDVISIYINTYNTNKIPEEEIINKIKNRFDLSPKGIINELNLRNIKYTDTTCYGHFGKENLEWEKEKKF